MLPNHVIVITCSILVSHDDHHDGVQNGCVCSAFGGNRFVTTYARVMNFYWNKFNSFFYVVTF